MTDWVMHIPVITTAHLTQEVAQALAEVLPGEDFYGLYCAVTAHGGFVAFGELGPMDLLELPKCLADVARWARRTGTPEECWEWVRFDADGDQIGELTVYEW